MPHYLPFQNRSAAGRLLAKELEPAAGPGCIVLGIPRGGVIVAHQIAHALGIEMDVILTHKISAPGYQELAVGAVTETGKAFIPKHHADLEEDEYLRAEKARQFEMLQERARLYRQVLPRASWHGRIVIVTDDGLATGFTMLAALWAARQEHPRKLIAAVPVAASQSLREIERHADETLCLYSTPHFLSVGQFYEDFREVSDEELLDILKKEAEVRHAS